MVRQGVFLGMMNDVVKYVGALIDSLGPMNFVRDKILQMQSTTSYKSHRIQDTLAENNRNLCFAKK